MRKYKAHRLTKRLDIPDCIQLATQRLTKYPLLLENILKNTENRFRKSFKKFYRQYLCFFKFGCKINRTWSRISDPKSLKFENKVLRTLNFVY